jgi:amino acid adenylation domain-containing protein
MSGRNASLDAMELAEQKRRLFEYMLRQEGIETSDGETILPQQHEGELPLSFAQQRLWFLDQMDPGRATYNIPAAVRLSGQLDVRALERSLDIIVRRHESLRTQFAAVDGRPIQIVIPHVDLSLPVTDLNHVPAAEHEQTVLRLAAEEALVSFDLTSAPLMRVGLLRFDKSEHVLLLTLHHIISDGWSMGVMIREIVTLYSALVRGTNPRLPELPIQYKDYTLWQRDWLTGQVLEEQLEYWKKQLGGDLPALTLPTDHPRQAVQSHSGAFEARLLPQELSTRLQGLSQVEGVTLFVMLLAAFKALLYRYSGQEDIVVGVPVANRARPELEDLIGFFANTLVMRTNLSGDPAFRELLARVREVSFDAYAHQDIPFEKVVEELQPARHVSYTPLFQVMFVLQNAPMPAVEIAELNLSPINVGSGTAKFDLMLFIDDRPDRLNASVEYRTDLFEASTVRRLLSHYEILLRAIVTNPDERISCLRILTDDELQSLELDLKRPHAELGPPRTLIDLFEQQAARSRDAVAVVFDDQALSYGDLNRRSNKLARSLQSLGAGSERLVGICMERSLDLVVGLAGVLKSGSAYVPLDPSYPRSRTSLILQDSGVSVLVTQQAVVEGLGEMDVGIICIDRDWEAIKDEGARNPEWSISPDNAAYVIYTSGSTGKPKGVVVSHANVVRLFKATDSKFHFSSRDVWTLFHSCAFDFSVWEIWGALIYGGRLIVVPFWVSRSPESYRQLLAAEAVTIVNQTPSAMRQLTEAQEGGVIPQALRAVILGGEALELSSLRRWLDSYGDEKPHIINMYGITETTVHVTYRRIMKADLDSGRRSPIGEPIDDLSIYVLDPQLQPAPTSVAGEICVGGEGVARGYLNRAALTADRFRPDRLSTRPGARMYRSGDQGRATLQRDIEYLGRIDEQVKIRGFRIETGEIEAALNAHPKVAQSVVVAGQDHAPDKRLIGYVLPRSAERLAADELREFLKEKLPDYMVPAAIVPIDRIPLTAHGKVDRKSLPDVDWRSLDSKSPFVPPSNPVEQVLADVWSSVLCSGKIGIDDNFFALGGDSILSIQIRSRAREKGFDFSLQQLFRYQTIRELSQQVRAIESPADEEGAESLLEADRKRFRLVAERDCRRLPSDCENAYPVSELQAGMVFHSEYTTDYIAYITSFHLRVPFDAGKLQLALDQMCARHEMLRTSFDLSRYSEPLQLVHKRAFLTLAVEDLRSLSTAEQDRWIEDWTTAETRKKFNWTEAPLIRIQVHIRGEDSIQFSMTEPFFDGWSVASFLTELFERYLGLLGGRALAADPLLEASYEDFVELEREALQSDECRRYWEDTLRGASACRLARWPFETGGDIPREVVRMGVDVPAEVSDGLKALARSTGVSLKSVLLAAHLKVVSLLSGQPEPITGLLINGRPERIDGERLLGAFLNTAPFKVSLDVETWTELVRRVFEGEQELIPFRRYPIQELQRRYRAEDLFDTIFNYTHFHVLDRLKGLKELEVLAQTGSEQTYYALTAQFNIDGSTARVRLELDYRTLDLGEAQVRDIAGSYTRVLATMAAQPASQHHTCLVSDRELRLISDLNHTASATSDSKSVLVRFEEQVERTASAVAVASDECEVSYSELNRWANRLAHGLKRAGVTIESRVGICIGRSVEMIVALLGVLKAGGSYLPLDPDYPQERIRFMLDDSDAEMLIAKGEFAETAYGPYSRILKLDSLWHEISRESDENPLCILRPANLSYVIYTSGSTGKPKGVLIEHGGLANVIEASTKAFDVNANSRVAQLASLSFDASVLEIFTALTTGATLCLVKREVVSSGADLAEALNRQSITTTMLPPSTLERIPAGDFRALTTIVVGGEACGPETAALWSVGRRFWNAYAPTEATIYATAKACDPGMKLTPTLGRPIANMRVYNLDSDLNFVPIGVAGEIFVGGAGVARGYLNRAELTAERFIPDGFSGQPGQRLYRTGDLARSRVGGEFEFLGRVDRQVKIRGFRIELGEIECALSACPEVKEAVVVAQGDSLAQKRLVAYVVPRGRDGFKANPLHSYLKAKLPEYMVPSVFVPMQSLPVTAAGKLDRATLPAPEQARPALTQEYVPPRTPIEELLAVEWAELLGLDQVGIRDSFFELGGHSLLATQAISRVRAAFKAELPLRALFESPTIERLGARLEEALRADNGSTAPPIVRVSHDVPLPLSFAQQRLWFLDQFEPGSLLYNIAAAVSIEGLIDIDVLELAIREVARRHESLRTTFSSQAGTPLQVIGEISAVELEVKDLRQSKPDDRMQQARSLAELESRKPFSLAAGPLLRAAIIRLGDDTSWLLITMHHIISDGWSIGIFVSELARLYEAFRQARPSPLAELAIQYSDFAVWQRGWLTGGALERQLEYWKENLAGSPPVLDLPSDRSRPPVQTSNGAAESLSLGGETTGRIKEFCRIECVTPFMSLLSIFDVLAYRYSGQRDILVGTPIANRNLADVEPLIGFFVNTIVLRVDISGESTFRELLSGVRETALNAYAHQDLPFEKLVEELNPSRNTSHSPFFQVMLDVQNAPLQPLHLSGLHITPLLLESNTAKFDLTFTFAETSAGLVASLEYNTDLFDRETILRMLGHFQNLLQQAIADPDQQIRAIPMMTEREVRQVLTDWNNTDAERPSGKCVHELFEEQVYRTLERIAVAFGDERLTFIELSLRAARLAGYLRTLGIGPESRVGICSERGADLIVALIGILKAGAAYVPIDPSSPRERLDLILRDSGTAVLLTQERLVDTIGLEEPAVVSLDRDREAIERASLLRSSDACSDNLAYVIYTSGSTGKPKGVAVTHGALVNSTLARLMYYREPVSAFLLLSPPVFDSSVVGIFWSLCGGGTLVIPDQESLLDPQRIGELISSCSISHLLALPTLYSLILDQKPAEQLRSLRLAIVAGESCPVDLVAHHERRCRGVELFNEYGPTEATVWSTVARCDDRHWMRRVPIGRPIRNTRIYILDSLMKPTPVGVTGEMYVGGDGLARGYLGRPELTAERFIPDSFGRGPGYRLYKTGDLGRFLRNGDIEFLGRNDFQVKLRGMRIELGEIESVLRRHDGVRDAVVKLIDGAHAGDKRLVAYVVEEGGSGVSGRDLREHLKQKLPDYMVPASFVHMDEMPLTPSGKVNRLGLPAPDGGDLGDDEEYEEPEGAVEKVIGGIWEEVLGKRRVGASENFFEIGGHSLVATQVMSRVREALRVEVELRKLFENPTVRGLAGAILAPPDTRARIEKAAEILLAVRELPEEETRAMLQERRLGASAKEKLP